MVKLQGPMFSIGASGSIGKAVTYSNWKGRAYARQNVVPANPNKEKQISVRAMMKFLSQQWSGLAPAQKMTWNDLADQKVISPFNAYAGFNLERWSHFLGITQGLPVTFTGPASTTGVATAVGGVRMVTVTMPITSGNAGWCVFIFRKTGGAVTPAFDNLVHIGAISATNPIVFVDTPLEPATYHYNFYLCSIKALFDFENQPVNAAASA